MSNKFDNLDNLKLNTAEVLRFTTIDREPLFVGKYDIDVVIARWGGGSVIYTGLHSFEVQDAPEDVLGWLDAIDESNG